MDDFVEISIPVEAEAAKALGDAHARAAIGRVISRMVRPNKGEDPLLDAMVRLSAEAARRGLTQDILDDELAAYNAERGETGSSIFLAKMDQ
jgi:hypothetical protein